MKLILMLLFCLTVAVPFALADRRPAVGPEVKKVGQANNAFAADLFKQLSSKEGNLFFSPTSISTALAMAYGGARGDTADQMVEVMHYPYEGDKLHVAVGALMAHLNPAGDNDKRPFQLTVANALWGEQTTDFKQDYIKSTEKHYGAGLTPMDFKTAAEDSRKTINAWVEENTQNKIKNLVPPGVLTPDTRLVLTNAIYFKSAWADQFSEHATGKQPFNLSADKSVEVPTMRRVGHYGYARHDRLQAVEIPYERHELSMVVLLPEAVDGLPALEKNLTADNLARWTANLKATRVDLQLPKFKTTSTFELADLLKAMGMTLAFDPRKANFSGITTEDALYISNVIHKAFVDVHEKGTEAAAATAVVMKATSAMPVTKPVVMKIDRPFVFVIRDNQSGTILFMGRIADPTK